MISQSDQSIYEAPGYEVVEDAGDEEIEFFAPAAGAIAIISVVVVISPPQPVY